MTSTAIYTGTIGKLNRIALDALQFGDKSEWQRQFGETIFAAAGGTLYHEDDEATYIYKVVEGAVRAFTHTEDGRRQVNGFYFRGDTFGSGRSGQYRSSAEVISDSTLIRYRRLKHSSAADLTFDQLLLEAALSEIRAAEQQILLLGRLSSCSKVAAFLLYLAEQFGSDGEAEKVIEIPMTRYDIADFLGLSAESVSRSLTKLKLRGKIAMDTPNEVTLLDFEALSDIKRGF